MKDNTQRARLAIIMLWVSLAVSVLMMVSSYLQYSLLLDYDAGVEITEAELEANDIREIAVALLFVAVHITTIVVFIQWFRRAYYNLHQISTELSYSEGWAAGSWFVPILNLVRPYKIMRELYVETQRLLHDQLAGIELKSQRQLVGIWWAFWIVVSILSNVESRVPEDTIDSLIFSSGLGIFSNAVSVAAAFFAVRVVKNYAAMEPMLRRLDTPDANLLLLNANGELDDILDAM